MSAHRLEERRWFQEAQADLTVVHTLRGARHHAAACFHSQQAAEKACFRRSGGRHCAPGPVLYHNMSQLKNSEARVISPSER